MAADVVLNFEKFQYNFN